MHKETGDPGIKVEVLKIMQIWDWIVFVSNHVFYKAISEHNNFTAVTYLEYWKGKGSTSVICLEY